MNAARMTYKKKPDYSARDTPREIIEKFKEFCAQNDGYFAKTYDRENGGKVLICEFNGWEPVEYLFDTMSDYNNTYLTLKTPNTRHGEHLFLSLGRAVLNIESADDIVDSLEGGNNFFAVMRGRVVAKRIMLFMPRSSQEPVYVLFEKV